MNEPSADDAARWLQRLVRIPSVTPDQGGDGEASIASALANWLSDMGLSVEMEEVLPGRPNVYAIRPGRTARLVALDVHTDTVSTEGMVDDPFDGRIQNGRVYGRGAVDTKASLAVALSLLEWLANAGGQSGPTLLIAATVDEETGTRGAPACARWLKRRGHRPNEMIVAEPTGCRPVHGHKGVCRFSVEVQGRGAHSATPDEGENAVTAAASIVSALASEDSRLRSLPESVLGWGRLTVTGIAGGEGINLVPARCTIQVDRRLVAGEKPDEVANSLVRLAAGCTTTPVQMYPSIMQPAFQESASSAWMKKLAAWCGVEPVIVPYGTNAFAYVGCAEGLAVLGPGSIAQAHGPEEWIEISELSRLMEIYRLWWDV